MDQGKIFEVNKGKRGVRTPEVEKLCFFGNNLTFAKVDKEREVKPYPPNMNNLLFPLPSEANRIKKGYLVVPGPYQRQWKKYYSCHI